MFDASTAHQFLFKPLLQRVKKMQSLKNILINGLIVLALTFGLITAAAALSASDFERDKALAEQGDSFDQNYLGYYYEEGVGVRQDYTKAFYWFKKAADQGYASGQFNVAVAYTDGLGVRQDYTKAIYWFKKAADQNHTSTQLYLGTMYENGIGVRPSSASAKEWYGKACDNGNQNGCDNYKRLHLQRY